MSPYRVLVSCLPRELKSYGVTHNGFLPEHDPLSRLPHEYYKPWEDIMAAFPELVRSRIIRRQIDQMSILTTSQLETQPEWQRAYSILAFMAQGYIWSGDKPLEVRQLRSM